MTALKKPPIIIIGAGRSGTNILRDSLVKVDGFATWPCDEINLIWRHGNIAKPDDVFKARDANPKIANYIRAEFKKIETKFQAHTVVEKTCANSLRIPFILSIFPDARFINITRDGRDVTASAMKRWRSGIDLGYLKKKLPYVPKTDIPYYAARFAANRVYQLFSRDNRQSVWGPRFANMCEIVASRPLDEVCALQWAQCVRQSHEDLTNLPNDQLFNITYEQFVTAPGKTMKAIFDWIGYGMPSDSVLKGYGKQVRNNSVDNWVDAGLGEEALRIIDDVGDGIVK